MAKELTKEQLAKKQAKEQKEIARLKKDQQFHSRKYYLLILTIVLTVVYIIDELTSSVRGTVETYTICDLFNVSFGSAEYDDAAVMLNLVTVGLYLIYLISPFYKSLADRFGRRIFLIINTIGMGVCLALSIITVSVALYLVVCVIMTFFTPNDMQVIYIMECAPKQHRAKLCSITKGIALISVSLLGILVNNFVSYENASSWKVVYFVPMILAFVVGIAAIFLVKETPAYAEKRLQYLELSEEEREQQTQLEKEQQEKEKNTNPSVFSAFKYIFTHKQTLYIAIIAIIFSFATGYTGKYQTIIEAGVARGAITSSDSSAILMIYPLINGIFTLIGGFITDKLGRKKSALSLGAWSAGGVIVFAIGCLVGLNGWVSGIAYGVSIAGLWSISDMIFFIITSENTPTSMRGSVVGSMQLLGMVGTGLNMVWNSAATALFGSMNLGIALTASYLPLMIIALVIMMLKVKETKDVDLNAIEED